MAFAIICPPLRFGHVLYVTGFSGLKAKIRKAEGIPKLLLIGDSDQFCSPSGFTGYVDELPEPKESRIYEGADHFGLFRLLPEALERWLPAAFGMASLQEFAAKGAPPGRSVGDLLRG